MDFDQASTRFADNPALSRSQRAALVLGLFVIHIIVIVSVIFSAREPAVRTIRNGNTAAYVVPLAPPPLPSPVPASPPAGPEGASAKRAKPKPVVAPPARIPNKAMAAAPAASTGDATRSGANSAGTGTGGGASGIGAGSGGSGDGWGAGGSRAVKIAGDITATRDYPARTRAARIGTSVIVVLTVGTDGRVQGCRILQPSPDAEADAITCRLARERFRFRPATDRAGHPIESEFGWRQRWFAP